MPSSGPDPGRAAEQHDAGEAGPAQEGGLHRRAVPHGAEAAGPANVHPKETLLCQQGKPAA